MLSVASGSKVYLAAEPVDLRRGHDGLTALVRARFGMDPLDGHLFVFLGRRLDRVKILFWDRGGFVLYYKRLARGRFRMPRIPSGALRVELDGTELAMLLGGFDLTAGIRRTLAWEPRARRQRVA
jgi:transposase